VAVGDEMRLSGSEWVVRVLRTCHTMPSVGYGFYAERRKLKPEYVGRTDIAQLVAAGTAVSDVVRVPAFAYLGDTTVAVFAASPELLCAFPTIVTECTYLAKKESADDRGHSCWPDLRPIVEGHPDITFVFTHFSLSHSAAEIRDTFRGIPNVIPWISPS
jgi:ribonuclease Z